MIIVYCQSGVRSKKVSSYLINNDYNSKSLAGGLALLVNSLK